MPDYSTQILQDGQTDSSLKTNPLLQSSPVTTNDNLTLISTSDTNIRNADNDFTLNTVEQLVLLNIRNGNIYRTTLSQSIINILSSISNLKSLGSNLPDLGGLLFSTEIDAHGHLKLHASTQAIRKTVSVELEQALYTLRLDFSELMRVHFTQTDIQAIQRAIHGNLADISLVSHIQSHHQYRPPQSTYSHIIPAHFFNKQIFNGKKAYISVELFVNLCKRAFHEFHIVDPLDQLTAIASHTNGGPQFFISKQIELAMKTSTPPDMEAIFAKLISTYAYTATPQSHIRALQISKFSLSALILVTLRYLLHLRKDYSRHLLILLVLWNFIHSLNCTQHYRKMVTKLPLILHASAIIKASTLKFLQWNTTFFFEFAIISDTVVNVNLEMRADFHIT